MNLKHFLQQRVNNPIIFLGLMIGILCSNLSFGQSQDYTIPGTGNFVVPDKVTRLRVSLWGAGGGGGFEKGNKGATGGGGGAFMSSINYPVTPRAVIPYRVGLGGVPQTNTVDPGGDGNGGVSFLGTGSFMLEAEGGARGKDNSGSGSGADASSSSYANSATDGGSSLMPSRALGPFSAILFCCFLDFYC